MQIIKYNKYDKKLEKYIINKLKNNGLVILPSDTVYGLAADALNPTAVTKLLEFKSRPLGKPISVFVSDLNMAKHYVKINNNQHSILSLLLPGAFTVVFPSKHKTDRRLESENKTLGIRIPDYSIINNLVQKYQKPLTATSANISGDYPHYSVESLLNRLSFKKKQLIDLIIDKGPLPRNKPSTVVDYSRQKVTIIRHGSGEYKEKQISLSPQQTYNIGKKLMVKAADSQKKLPTVFFIEGEMGAGKTILIKGIASYFNILNIISPTFVIYYEYPIKNKKKFYHFDLFRIEDNNELCDLPFDDIIKNQSITAIEWAEKSGKIINKLKNKAEIIYIKMEYLIKDKRSIIINKS